MIANAPDHRAVTRNLSSFCHTNMGISDAVQLQKQDKGT